MFMFQLILKLKLQPHSSGVSAVEFSSDNNTLLSGARDGTVAATSIATGVTLRVLKDHRGANINAIVCSLRQVSWTMDSVIIPCPLSPSRPEVFELSASQ